MAFEVSPSYDSASPDALMGAAASVPYRGAPELGGALIPDTASEGVEQGLQQSFGAGTVMRDFMTPAGLTQPDPMISSFPVIGPIYQAERAAVNAFRPQQPAMSQQDYKDSPYFRDNVPYDPGMTEDRAASLAQQSDTTKVRDYFSQIRPVDSFVGNFLGQAVDPINYVPGFGEESAAALAARFGDGFLARTGASGLVGASNAAINTAAFGALSSGLRTKFGDDTSWQAYANEVGMAGMIGGAFGGVSGLIGGLRSGDRGTAPQTIQEQMMADEASTARNAQAARVPLNEAVGSLATEGDVSLSPNGIAPIQNLADEMVAKTQGARVLANETAGVEGSQPGQVAITPMGTRVNVSPEIVDASTLSPATGALQVRNRGSQASDAQIEQMASQLDPARLMPNVSADQGAPIVGPDNVVDSGNGRVAAINRAYDAYPEQAAAYRQSLVNAGYQIPDGMERPVLISRRTTDLSDEGRQQFNSEANLPSTARMSAVEIANMDRAALDDGVLSTHTDGSVTSPDNRPFVARFMANLSPNERGAMVDQEGNLSADGQRRIENALIAKAYADVDDGVVRKFAEATDDNTRSIVGAMSDVAGRWAQMRQASKFGDLDAAVDLTPELTRALRLLSDWRDQSKAEGRPVSNVIKEGMKQLDLLSGEISPETQAMIRAFYNSDDYTRAVGRDVLSGRLHRMLESMEELGRPQLFESPDVGSLQVIRNAIDNDESGDLFANAGSSERPQEVGGGRGINGAVGDSGVAGSPSSGSAELPAGLVAGQSERGAAGSGQGVIDASRGSLDPVPEGIKQAEVRVGKPDTLQEMAKDRGINLANGDYNEHPDIDQLRAEGGISEEDEKALAAADQTYTRAEAFGNAIKAAVSCIV